MTTLADTLKKYGTLNGNDLGVGNCLACGNGWYFDRGRIFTCTTCGADREVFTHEEEPASVQTRCTIRSGSEGGLKRGIEVYYKRFPKDKFSTIQLTPVRETLQDFWVVEMGRRTNELSEGDKKCK